MLRSSLAILTAGAIVLVAPAAPVAAAADPLAPPDRPQVGTVAGTFTDPAGTPIAGASVSSRSPEYNNRYTGATTDALGRYRLDNVPAGPVRLSFRHDRVTQYAPGKPREAEAQLFTVVPGLTTVVNERKVATGTVQGRLTEDDGTPVSAGSFSVTSEFSYVFAFQGKTDADGRYSISGIPAGTFTMTFGSGSRTQWAHDAATQAAATTFTLGAGQTLTVDESMRPTGRLTGRVNRVTRSTSVYAYEVGSTNSVSGSTDAEGRFSLAVPVGRWQVRVAGRQWVPREIDQADAQIFEVTAGKRAVVNDRLLPTGTVVASMRTPDRPGFSHTSFGLWHDGVLVHSGRGGNRGRTEFRNVLPGDYVFSYALSGSVNLYHPGTARIENATTIKVRPGKTKRVITYQPAGGTLTGRVTLPTGEPLPGLKVRADITATGVPLSYTATTGPDGVWSVDRIFPETYRVTVSNPTGKLTQDAGLITTTSGATSTVDTAWQQGGAITVDAVDATTGAPVDAFCVAVVAKFGDYCTAGSTVTAAGLEPGRTLVTLTPRGDKDYLISRDVAATVTTGGNTRITVPVTLGGRIHLETRSRTTGTPVQSQCVVPVEVGAGTDSRVCAYTNKSGKTTTQALPEGVYQLFVWDEGSYGAQWYTPEGGTGDQKSATKFRVKAGHTIKAGTALMDRSGTISGVVRDPAGQPVPGVDVSPIAYETFNWTATVSDSQGRYTMRGLGPYAWPLLFTPGPADLPRQWSGGTGNRFQATTVPVTSGATSTFDATLAAGTKVSGTVSVAPGGPAWSGGKLTARNVATGDILAVVDLPGTGGPYEFTVIGGRPVTIDWYLADPVHKAAGRLPDPVNIPAQGEKHLDLAIG